MGRLLLKFDDAVLREVSLGSRAVTIGRAPDNDIPIDNLAVSNYHARIYTEAGRLVIEDLNSLNGTFVNDQRVERAALHDGDTIVVGKHHIVVDESHDAALPLDPGRKVVAPKVDETMVLDTKQRREMLQLAVDAGERSQLAPSRMRARPQSAQRQNRPERVRALEQAHRHRQIGNGHRAAARMVRPGRRSANQQARGWLLPRPRRPRAQGQWSAHHWPYAAERRRSNRSRRRPAQLPVPRLVRETGNCRPEMPAAAGRVLTCHLRGQGNERANGFCEA